MKNKVELLGCYDVDETHACSARTDEEVVQEIDE